MTAKVLAFKSRTQRRVEWIICGLDEDTKRRLERYAERFWNGDVEQAASDFLKAALKPRSEKPRKRKGKR